MRTKSIILLIILIFSFSLYSEDKYMYVDGVLIRVPVVKEKKKKVETPEKKEQKKSTSIKSEKEVEAKEKDKNQEVYDDFDSFLTSLGDDLSQIAMESKDTDDDENKLTAIMGLRGVRVSNLGKMSPSWKSLKSIDYSYIKLSQLYLKNKQMLKAIEVLEEYLKEYPDSKVIGKIKKQIIILKNKAANLK